MLIIIEKYEKNKKNYINSKKKKKYYPDMASHLLDTA
jgi:hypothetical protein